LFSALASEFFISYHVVIEKGPRALLRQYRRSGRKDLQTDAPEGEDLT